MELHRGNLVTAPTSTKTIRAAMYLRQSIAKDGNEIKVSTQRQDVTELFQRRGIASWTEYKDNDMSASVRMPGSRKVSKRRPGFTRMMADIASGKLDIIGVADADRLYRHPRELEDIIDACDLAALELATVGGDFDLSTPNGRANARMRGVWARMEMEQKSVRHKREQKRMAEDDGRPWWPSRPFGFDADPDPTTGGWWTVRRHPTTKAIIAVNKIRKHPTEAKLLKQAYSKFLAGSSTRSLAKFWNDEGVLTPRGNQWTGSAIHQLLATPRNAGLRQYGDAVVGKGTWPSIVDEDTWAAARSKLKDPSRRTKASRAREHLLSGLALCGVCGKPLAASKNVRKVRLYVCGNDGCRKIVRGGEKLDEMIIETVVRRLSREDAVELLRPKVDPVDATALREERRILRDRLAQLGKDFTTAPPEFTRAALEEINRRLAEIKAVLDDPGKARIFEDVIGAKDVRRAFDKLDLGRRRTIIDALMLIRVNPVGKARKVFNPDAIDVRWKEDI